MRYSYVYMCALAKQVAGGFVGKIELDIPWTSLGRDPVLITISDVFALVHPSSKINTEDVSKEDELEAKRKLLNSAEEAWVNGKNKGNVRILL